MAFSPNEIKNARQTLKRTPPPKVPLSSSSDQHGNNLSNNGGLSVARARSKFERGVASPLKVHLGSSGSQNSGQTLDDGPRSIATARARFEKCPVNVSTKSGNPSNKAKVLDSNSNIQFEPQRVPLPPLFRIGAAPRKRAKPDHLRMLLGKFKDRIIISSGKTSSTIKSGIKGLKHDPSEDVYDDVESVIEESEGHQDDQSEDIYDDVGASEDNWIQGELYEVIEQAR